MYLFFVFVHYSKYEDEPSEDEVIDIFEVCWHFE